MKFMPKKPVIKVSGKNTAEMGVWQRLSGVTCTEKPAFLEAVSKFSFVTSHLVSLLSW